MKSKILLEAIATLVGTVIGAGILGIPYVIAQAGFLTGALCVVVIGVLITFLYLYLGETVLRTKGFHQLTGYAEIYLGKWGKRLMAFAMVFGIYGAMIAYIIGEGQALSAVFGGSAVMFSLLFFIIASLIIYFGLKKVAESELYMIPLILIIVLLVVILGLPHINVNNLYNFNFYNLLIPYGVVLFAFLGAAAIPEMEQELIRNRKLMKKAIVIGMMIPLFAYLLFAFMAVGVSGLSTTEIATIGLGQILGKHIVIIGNIFAVLAMATSFLTLGLAMKQMYDYDYKLDHLLSWGLTVFIPLGIALSGFTSFIKAIGAAGVVAGGIEGVLIVLMAFKAKKRGNRKPEYSLKMNWLIAGLFILIFVLGAGYYLLEMF